MARIVGNTCRLDYWNQQDKQYFWRSVLDYLVIWNANPCDHSMYLTDRFTGEVLWRQEHFCQSKEDGNTYDYGSLKLDHFTEEIFFLENGTRVMQLKLGHEPRCVYHMNKLPNWVDSHIVPLSQL